MGVLQWLHGQIIVARSMGLMPLILAFVAAAVLAIAIGQLDRDRQRRKRSPVIAVITGFGVQESRWHPGPIVVAQDVDGVTGSALVQPGQIAGCRVGDKIRAERDGMALYPRPAPCPIQLHPSLLQSKIGR